MSITRRKFDVFYILAIMWWEIIMVDWNLAETHLVSDSNCNIGILYYPHFFYNEWHVNLGLHLALVTLHKRFSIRIEQNRIDDTIYNS